jgi:hypothetical protein
MKEINGFAGDYRFLSNFWPCRVTMGEREYHSIEHAYQAAKYPEDEREIFMSCTPGQAKRLGRGRHLEGRLEIMEGLVRQKFATDPLRSLLVSTGDAELIEGNDWGDVYWGVYQGMGENHLGNILMKIRHELQGETP